MELRDALFPRLAPWLGNALPPTKCGLIWNGTRPIAEKVGGRQIGMSLVVRIVGQATFVPADAPM